MPSIEERVMSGFHHHQAGRLAEAEAVYRGVLQEQPRQPHALHLLGVVCHQTCRQPEAIELITQALAVHGPHPEFHCNLAAAYQVSGDWKQAEAHCRAALKLRPDYAEAHNNLGITLRDQRKHAEAEIEFREATRLNPQYADAFCNLGAVLHAQEKLTEAVAPLVEAVRLAPRHAIAHNSLGGVCLGLNQHEQAVIHTAEAVKLDPKFTRAFINLGMALERLQHYDEAALSFREAIGIEPNYLDAHIKLGSLLLNQGKTEEALAEFRTILKLDEDNPTAIMHLGKLVANGFHAFSDEELQTIRDMLNRPKIGLESRGRLHFALAQVLDKKGAYDEAFEHCRAANEVKRETCTKHGALFDHAAHSKYVDQLMAAFTPAYFERVRSFGTDSQLPVFIVGMPRSGTSLTEQILASHPQVHGAGELQEMDALAMTLPERLGQRDLGYPACIEHMPAQMARWFADQHVARLAQMGPGAVRVVDKAPLNFFQLGLIVTLFPRARIIHCRRNPVDTCLSCYFQNFAESFSFTLDQRSLGQYYREYERLMAYWTEVLPTKLYQLDYEAMTSDQEGTSRKLVAYLGLDWDERCLNFHETERTVRTFSALQVRQPMYRSSVDRWKRYETQLQPLIEALGRG